MRWRLQSDKLPHADKDLRLKIRQGESFRKGVARASLKART